MAVHIQLDTSSKYGECGAGMALGGGTADSDLQEGKYCNKGEFYNSKSYEWTWQDHYQAKRAATVLFNAVLFQFLKEFWLTWSTTHSVDASLCTDSVI